MTATSHQHQVTRLSFPVAQPYEQFRGRYEEAVPELDNQRLAELVRRGARWEEVVAEAAASAPHGFLIYWRSDHAPLMRLAGDALRCTGYLMGNHTVAERMYRYDPSVMQYVPLHTVIYEDAEGRTRFAVDQPSTVFLGFAQPEIAEVAGELDDKLSALLEDLDVWPSSGPR